MQVWRCRGKAALGSCVEEKRTTLKSHEAVVEATGVRLRRVRLLCVVVIASIGCLIGATSAQAFIYWSTGSYLSVGRSNLDGSAAAYNTYRELDTETCSVAVSGGYVYYGGRLNGDTIGRAPIAGGSANTNWIDGVSNPCALAIYGKYIYWVNEPDYYLTATGSIGRASLTGPQDIHQDFITDASGASAPIDHPCGLSVSAAGIYWTNSTGGTIGHANLDGTGATTLVSDAQAGCSITQAGSYLYWNTNSNPSNQLSPDGGTIARALANGADADLTWGTNLGNPCGLVSYSHYLYFGANGGTIARIDLDSPSLQSSETQVVQGNGIGCGIAVDGLYQGKVSVTGFRSARHGTVYLALKVSSPGRVSVKTAPHTPPLLAPASAITHLAGRLVLRLRPTRLGLLQLRHHHRLRTTLTVSYIPAGGLAQPVEVNPVLTR